MPNTLQDEIRDLHDAIRKALDAKSGIKVRKGKAGRPSAVPGKDRTLLYVASDETADRYGDIVRVKGWTLENFRKAPVLIWSHDYDRPPIGAVPNVYKAKDPKALMAEASYFPRDRSEFADSIYRLAEIGGIPGVSVGFMPLAYNDPADPEERKALGLGSQGFEFTESDLLEISQVSVPANPNAVGASYVTPEEFAKGLGLALSPAESRALFGRDEASIFVRDAGDFYAAAATPVLRDLSLLPSAPLISIPAGTINGTMTITGGAAVDTSTASANTFTIKQDTGDIDLTLAPPPAVLDIGAEISKAVKAACEQVAKSITESLTSELFLKSLHDAVRSATAGHATKAAPKPEPPVQSQVVASILESGLKERLDRLERLEKTLKK